MISLDTGKDLVVFLDRSVIVKFPPEYLINSVSDIHLTEYEEYEYLPLNMSSNPNNFPGAFGGLVLPFVSFSLGFFDKVTAKMRATATKTLTTIKGIPNFANCE